MKQHRRDSSDGGAGEGITEPEEDAMTVTRGVVHIHSASAALCPHVEWAVGGAIGAPVRLDWRPQPAEPGSLCAEYSWSGPVGTATRLASVLKRWTRVRFEVTEEATAASEAERYSYTPTLGVFHATVGLHGDIVVPEDRLRHAMIEACAGGRPLDEAIDALLGGPWDDELEVFRHAGDGAPVRWLHRVG